MPWPRSGRKSVVVMARLHSIADDLAAGEGIADEGDIVPVKRQIIRQGVGIISAVRQGSNARGRGDHR